MRHQSEGAEQATSDSETVAENVDGGMADLSDEEFYIKKWHYKDALIKGELYMIMFSRHCTKHPVY